MSRSEVMSRVRSHGTRLENRFAELARMEGLRLSVPKGVYGKPDFRIRRSSVLVFVNSCFWHGCVLHCRMPASRRAYWVPKIKSNITRQNQVVRKLRSQGYSVYVVWEHDFKDGTVIAKLRRMNSASKRI